MLSLLLSLFAPVSRLYARFLKLLRVLLLTIVKQGPVPRHVAFIMDGNRRYARTRNMATLSGHTLGFYTLERLLEWCLELGIKEVSVYAFSIENFKRPKEEVDGLMELAADKFRDMMQENKMIDKLGICVRVPGELSMVPEKLRKEMEKAIEYSKDNTRAILNVCFAYTAREEMTGAMRKMAATAKSAADHEREGKQRTRDEERMVRLMKGEKVTELPREEDGTWGEVHDDDDEREKKAEREWGWEDEMWNAMQVKTAPDLLVRTSGEVRLSDYLLWQTAFSVVVFLNVLWPDLSLWHFLYIIFMYQYQLPTMKERRKYYADNIKNRVECLGEKEEKLNFNSIVVEEAKAKQS